MLGRDLLKETRQTQSEIGQIGVPTHRDLLSQSSVPIIAHNPHLFNNGLHARRRPTRYPKRINLPPQPCLILVILPQHLESTRKEEGQYEADEEAGRYDGHRTELFGFGVELDINK